MLSTANLLFHPQCSKLERYQGGFVSGGVISSHAFKCKPVISFTVQQKGVVIRRICFRRSYQKSCFQLQNLLFHSQCSKQERYQRRFVSWCFPRWSWYLTNNELKQDQGRGIIYLISHNFAIIWPVGPSSSAKVC